MSFALIPREDLQQQVLEEARRQGVSPQEMLDAVVRQGLQQYAAAQTSVIPRRTPAVPKNNAPEENVPENNAATPDALLDERDENDPAEQAINERVEEAGRRLAALLRELQQQPLRSL